MIEITFTRTNTKVGTMEIVDPAYRAEDIANGVAAGALIITFGGQDQWGSIYCRDQTDHIVAHILEAEDDAGGAEYGNLTVE